MVERLIDFPQTSELRLTILVTNGESDVSEKHTAIRVTRNETVHDFQANIALKRLQLDCDGERATSHEKRRPDTGGRAKWAEEGGRTAAIQGHLFPVARPRTRF